MNSFASLCFADYLFIYQEKSLTIIVDAINIMYVSINVQIRIIMLRRIQKDKWGKVALKSVIQVLHYLKTFPHAFIDLRGYLKLLVLIGGE